MRGSVVARGHNAFHARVMQLSATGKPVVQPRMGFSDTSMMRAGLEATRAADAATVGTITLDSFTRVGDHRSAHAAIESGTALNGYPIVALGASRTRDMCAGVHDADFPIQVRHGSARPFEIVQTLIDAGFPATEGGPISYCLPYSRLPLKDAVESWAQTAELAAAGGLHVETFGGCMLGQLCPPSLLVALSVLESLFFVQRGVTSVSLSYAQQTSLDQDIAAVTAMRALADLYIGSRAEHHNVIYTYMGVFPLTGTGALRLLQQSVVLARSTRSERLIVKTTAEARGIPTIAENIAALELAGRAVANKRDVDLAEARTISAEADQLIRATLSLSPDVGEALLQAFSVGLLDVPFCLHADNANDARAAIAPNGRLVWTNAGAMPVDVSERDTPVLAGQLLRMLNYNQTRFDREQLTAGADRGVTA